MGVPTKLISASQPFQDGHGTAVANGKIRLTLSQVAEVISGGGQVTTQPLILSLDSAGKLAATAIWFNDELTPSGTTYHVELLGSNGFLLINDYGYASVAGASFDLSTAVFSAAPPGPTFSGAVLLTPSGNQTITAGDLIINNGLTVSGNVTETAGQNQFKAYSFNSVIWLDGIKYTSLQAAYAAVSAATFAASGDGIGNVWTGGGGVVEVPPGWSESSAWTSDLVLKNGVSIHFNGPAYFNQGTHQVTMAGNIHGVSIIAPYGDHSQRTSGVTFDYSGNGDAWAIGDGTNNGPVSDIRIENIQIHTINGGLASNALHVHGSQYCNFINLDLVVANGATNTGNGLLMDGTGTNVFNTQNVLQGLTINFANNPVSFTGVNTDNVYIGGLIGNPHGTGGPGFSIAGSSTRNLFLNTAVLSGTFASLFNFGGTANGNKVIAAANAGSVTTTVVFGATATNNVFESIDGTPTVTDSGTANSVLDPATFKRNQAGKIAIYNALTTVGNGLASELAVVDLSAQAANIGTTTAYAVPSTGAGLYRVQVYSPLTQAASVSSTMVSVVLGWTDKNNNTAVTFTMSAGTPAANAISATTTTVYGTFLLNIKASTNITYQTTSYASSGGTPMQYALAISIEKL